MALIDRDSAVNAICKTKCIREFNQCSHLEPCEDVRILTQQPVIDAKPVVYAEWEETPYCRSDANHVGSPSARFRCTHCKHRTGYVNAMKWDFCPYCGADTRGDTNASAD